MRRILPVLLASTALSCSDGGDPISIDDRTGVVQGIAYVDRNADGMFTSASDALAQGAVAALVLDATGDTAATAITAADGSFRMADVPIGRYRLVARRGALGDTVDVQAIVDPVFSLASNDTVVRDIRIGYPHVSTADLRGLPAGRRAVVEGIALNAWSTFGDSSVHVLDDEGSIRAVRVAQSGLQAGDSVRLLGTVASRDGQPVLTAVTPTIIRTGVGLPSADSVSTMTAASASAGVMDAGLARVAGPIVAAQTLPNGDMLIGVNDGSGLLEVLLDDQIPFVAAQFQPGALLRATGVLVPSGGTWQLKPRSSADASATYETVSVAEARALPVGKTVYIEGVALNARVTFGDNTVHVRDASDVIRTLGVPQTAILAGDSVRILGTVAMRNGQPVLTASAASVLLAGVGLPAIDSASTAIAASAEGGVRDADHVAVSGVISATANRGGGEVTLTISDGSGDLIVVLDPDVGFATGNYGVGDSVRVRGVLVPAADGTSWELKPRSTGEIAVN